MNFIRFIFTISLLFFASQGFAGESVDDTKSCTKSIQSLSTLQKTAKSHDNQDNASQKKEEYQILWSDTKKNAHCLLALYVLAIIAYFYSNIFKY